jgi:hypothetical protein
LYCVVFGSRGEVDKRSEAFVPLNRVGSHKSRDWSNG